MNHRRKRKRHPFFLKKQRKQMNLFSKANDGLAEVCFVKCFFHRIERGRSPKCWLPTHSRLRWTWLCESVWRKSLHLWDENCWTEENPRNHSISGSCCCWALEKSMILWGILFSSRDPSPTNSAPRFTWSRNRSTAALSGAPVLWPSFLPLQLNGLKNLSKTSGDAPEQPWTGHHFL